MNPKGSVSQVYIEFDHGVQNRKATGATCSYSVQGYTADIRIVARDEAALLTANLQYLSASHATIETSSTDLGWSQDGTKYFVLSGRDGHFSSSGLPSDWMQQNLQTLGGRTLREICMPGSHDAGMGKITWSDHIPEFLVSDFTRTQTFEIYYQLDSGSRYLDVRPHLSEGRHWTGHYMGKLGARGQSMESIVDDINRFTATNAELIVVNLSHDTQCDDEFRHYNRDEWHSLLQQLLGLNRLFILPADSGATTLLDLKLADLIGGGRAAVVVVIEPNDPLDLGEFAGRGFYPPALFGVFNSFANTDDCVRLREDQLRKLAAHGAAAALAAEQHGDKSLFLLSWTLTQQKPDGPEFVEYWRDPAKAVENLLPWLRKLKAIRVMAYSANKSLMVDLLPHVGREAFPNILYVDFIETRDCAALAMVINHLIYGNDS